MTTEHRITHERNVDGTPGCGFDLSERCSYFQLPVAQGKMMTVIVVPLICEGCKKGMVAAPGQVQVAKAVPVT